MGLTAADAFLQQVGVRERNWLRVGAVCLGGLLLSLIAAVLVVALAAVLFGDGRDVAQLLRASPGQSLMNSAPVFAVAGLSLGLAGYAFLQIASFVYRRPILSFLTAAPRFRWRAVAAGLMVAAPIGLAALAIEGLWSPLPGEPPLLDAGETVAARCAYALVAAVFLFLAAFGEEAVFRGLMVQQAAAFLRRKVVIVLVTGVVFSLVHADADPTALLVRAVLGIAFAWMVLKTGGVEFAAGAHLANNLVIALFAAPPSLQARSPEPFEWKGFLLQATAALAVALLLAAAVRHPRLAARLGLAL